jgi:hypothetical protein
MCVGLRAGSSILLGVDSVCVRLCLPRCALKPYCLLGGGEPLVLGSLLDGVGTGLLGVSLALDGRLLFLFGSLSVVLRLLAIAFDLLVASLRLDLVLEPAAFGFRLGPLLLELGLGRTLAGLGGLTSRDRFRLGLGLLQPALALELVLADGGAGELLGLAYDLADDAAGGPFI